MANKRRYWVFGSIVGAGLYVSNCMIHMDNVADISYKLGRLNQYAERPEPDIEKLFRLLKYDDELQEIIRIGEASTRQLNRAKSERERLWEDLTRESVESTITYYSDARKDLLTLQNNLQRELKSEKRKAFLFF